MKKLIPYRKLILVFGIILTLLFAAVYLIFGEGEDKVSNTVMLLAVPLMLFGFFRFAFYMWTKKKMYGTVNFFSWFLFLGGLFFIGGGLIVAVYNFPYTVSPPLSIGLAMVVCVLYANAKFDEHSDT